MGNEELQRAIATVQKAAEADTTGNGPQHVALLDAIRELNNAAETPEERLMRLRFEPLQSTAIRIALELGALDAIAARDGQVVTAEELGKDLDYDALLIERILRLTSWCGVVEETAPASYAANATTKLIVTPGMRGGEKHHYDLLFPIGAALPDLIQQKAFHQFLYDGKKTAFEHTFKKPFFKFFAEDKHHRRYFDDYMAARRVGLMKWHKVFPFDPHLTKDAKVGPDAVLLVDVGGNVGHELASFAHCHKHHPGRLVLQDLPQLIEKVEKEGKPNGVDECVGYDFFAPQPIKGARAYYFRNICHDWDDESCVKFLTNTAQAMEPGYSRMLIDDYVLPDTKAPVRGASMDLLMMLFCGGIERTRRQWEALLDRCGLRIVKVWGDRSDYESIIEIVRKE